VRHVDDGGLVDALELAISLYTLPHSLPLLS